MDRTMLSYKQSLVLKKLCRFSSTVHGSRSTHLIQLPPVVDRPVLLYVLYTDLGTRNRSVVLAPVLLYVLYTDLGTRNRSVVLAPLIYANSVFFLVFKVADDK
jgi:hypothetical protein